MFTEKLSWPIGTLFNSFLASSDFCQLLVTFANRLDPDQDQQNVDPDLDRNCLTHQIVFLKGFFKVHFKKSADSNKT